MLFFTDVVQQIPKQKYFYGTLMESHLPKFSRLQEVK